jgi:transposase
MGQNFIVCDREQELLLPPSLRDWLAEDHLVWCVLDAVAAMDLAVFYGAYRRDGWGRAAHDPAMMVALLLYAYAIGERSSRQVERRCREDVAFRVITANQVPDHATIARFRVRHQEALAGLFSQVLALCARAGLVSVGVVALDGTKVHANASGQANRSYEQIARELLAEADRVDAVEDEQFGDRRGDELPCGLADRASRRARLAEAKRQIEAEREAAQQAHRDRLEARAEREAELGHRLSGPKPKAPPARVDPQARANVTDPDSRSVKTHRGFMQGYNAQAVATSGQVIIAADVMIGSSDGGLLEPMLNAAAGELAAADIDEQIDVALADAGYWSGEQIDTLVADGIQVLVAPDGHTRGESPSPLRRGGRYDFMRRVLGTDRGRALYRQRGQTIEPIFGQTKHNRRADRFQRRGLAACRSEWRLITATHNLLKYWRATTAPTTG